MIDKVLGSGAELAATVREGVTWVSTSNGRGSDLLFSVWQMQLLSHSWNPYERKRQICSAQYRYLAWCQGSRARAEVLT